MGHIRRLARERTEATAGLLLLDQAVDPAEEDLSGTVAADLAAQGTRDNGVPIEGKDFNSRRNVAPAEHYCIRLDSLLSPELPS